jgi:hypothetical protein
LSSTIELPEVCHHPLSILSFPILPLGPNDVIPYQ